MAIVTMHATPGDGQSASHAIFSRFEKPSKVAIHFMPAASAKKEGRGIDEFIVSVVLCW